MLHFVLHRLEKRHFRGNNRSDVKSEIPYKIKLRVKRSENIGFELSGFGRFKSCYSDCKILDFSRIFLSWCISCCIDFQNGNSPFYQEQGQLLSQSRFSRAVRTVPAVKPAVNPLL